jgi:hypothetical protein
LRFAVRRPGIPEASPRSHGVSRRDVPSRIDISVAGEAAGSAEETRLALARRLVYLTTCRATLTCIMRLNLLHPASCLFSQSADKEAPARSHNLPIETGLGTDVLAWILGSSPSRARHISDLEILHPNHIEPARDVRTDLLYPVFPPVRLAGLEPGNGQPHPCAAIRSAPGSCELALQALHALAESNGQAWGVQQFPGRKGGGDGYAPINSYSFPVVWRRDRVGNSREGDMPAPRPVHRYSVGLHTRGHCTRPTEPYPPNLRHPDLADVAGHAVYVPRLPASPHDAKSLVPAGLAPPRPPGWVVWVEERGPCLRKVPQRLLLHHLGSCSQPRVFAARLRELSALLQVTRGARPARTPMCMLLDGQIPHVPGMGAVSPQRHRLSWRGQQPVSGHTNIVASSTDISGEVKRCSPFGSKAGPFTPRSS